MSISIGQYKFEGPYTTAENLEDRSGIYVILCSKNGKNFVIDVGESAEVRSRVENHDRADCWRRNCSGTLKVAVLYTPHLHATGRIEIEQEIRAKYDPPCGKR